MTLYLLFEKLEAGKVKLWNTMEVSEHASEQAPTKLGLKPGSEITIEDAIKGLVTRSANDAAVVIAEALGGSEQEFARQMTRKAHALGMTRTVYRNASGLPDDEQVTTARDQAILGIAIQDRFPTYYRYFSTPSFVFRGSVIRNHNHLIGSVAGVDGIKTGYTRASGLQPGDLDQPRRPSRRRRRAGRQHGRHRRDARMRDLLGAHLMEASIGRTTIQVADARPRSLDLQPEPRVRVRGEAGAEVHRGARTGDHAARLGDKPAGQFPGRDPGDDPRPSDGLERADQASPGEDRGVQLSAGEERPGARRGKTGRAQSCRGEGRRGEA